MAAASPAHPRSLGRFRIVRSLGRGAQSEVYLAFDPRLEREVALKTVRLSDADLSAAQTLLREARTVSKLNHPSIVSVFEADTADGSPYLIFEYVRGQTLAERLRSGKRLSPQEAVALLLPVLEAVEHAHRNSVIHRDLKPSNILLDDKGQPKVMDFGIAVAHYREGSEPGVLVGTPAYMAPEYVTEQRITPQMDIFSAGLILYELLVGRAAIPETDAYQALQRIAHDDIRLPADLSAAIDDRLRDIVHKALMRDCAMRYPSMASFKEALTGWLKPAAQTAEKFAPGQQSTLNFLLRRMKLKTDFPALSEAIGRINRLATSESENINTLANAILKDFALTNKILRMVNSTFYRGVGGGTVSTVSRAINVLGVMTVRNLAVSLILCEHMQNKAQVAVLQEEFTRANLCGVLARDLRGKFARDGEEAFICAMFHRLGRMLALYYFPEEADGVARLANQESIAEDSAAARILGISYQELGIGIARSWGFPNSMVNSMRSVPPEVPLRKPETREETLRLLAQFASEVCGTMAASKDNPGATREKLTARFGPLLGVDDELLEATLEQAAGEVQELASILRLNLNQTVLGQEVIRIAHPKAVADSSALDEHSLDQAAAHATQTLTLAYDMEIADSATARSRVSFPPVPAPNSAGRLEDVSSLPLLSGPSADGLETSGERQEIMMTGIQDISNTLVENFQLNDVVRMVLETMFRAMGFQRVLFCLRDPKAHVLAARVGFGKGADEVAARFRVPLNQPEDLFSIAAAKRLDLLISDANAPNIAARIPAWFREVVDARTFLLLPISVRDMTVALIYADQSLAGQIVITEKELSLLRTLRNQVVLAMKGSRR